MPSRLQKRKVELVEIVSAAYEKSPCARPSWVTTVRPYIVRGVYTNFIRVRHGVFSAFKVADNCHFALFAEDCK